MAVINAKGIAEVVAKAATGAATLGDCGVEFNDCMLNRAPGSSNYGAGFSASGVFLCYGNDEGFPAIMRAFENLKESMTAAEFGSRIAHALQAVVDPYPTGQHNLLYPHFLLHGINQPTADEAVAKILDNARILTESGAAHDELSDAFGPARSLLDNKFSLTLTDGFGDDFEALSMQLFRRSDDERRSEQLYAKAGFHFDRSQSCAYICNLQGRSPSRSSDPTVHKAELKAGRAYGRFSHEYGSDPREFVLHRLFDFLRSQAVTVVRAIRPGEHLSAIGNHHGFFGRYDEILASAGMEVESDIYRIKHLDAEGI